MTNLEVVAKKLAFMESCVRDLRVHARPEAFAADLTQLRFAEHTLQIAIQAALDVASHIVSDERLAEPKTNADLFKTLVREGYLPVELEDTLIKMAGFRNVLVHGYVDVDALEVARVVRDKLGDLEAFVQAIRTRLGGFV